jgi:hypothetical protein
MSEDQSGVFVGRTDRCPVDRFVRLVLAQGSSHCHGGGRTLFDGQPYQEPPRRLPMVAASSQAAYWRSLSTWARKARSWPRVSCCSSTAPSVEMTYASRGPSRSPKSWRRTYFGALGGYRRFQLSMGTVGPR